MVESVESVEFLIHLRVEVQMGGHLCLRTTSLVWYVGELAEFDSGKADFGRTLSLDAPLRPIPAPRCGVSNLEKLFRFVDAHISVGRELAFFVVPYPKQRSVTYAESMIFPMSSTSPAVPGFRKGAISKFSMIY